VKAGQPIHSGHLNVERHDLGIELTNQFVGKNKTRSRPTEQFIAVSDAPALCGFRFRLHGRARVARENPDDKNDDAHCDEKRTSRRRQLQQQTAYHQHRSDR
jgi:hypothetical protein